MRRSRILGRPDLVDFVVGLDDVAVVVTLDRTLGVAADAQLGGGLARALARGVVGEQRSPTATTQNVVQQHHNHADDPDPAAAERDRRPEPAPTPVIDPGDIDVLVVERYWGFSAAARAIAEGLRRRKPSFGWRRRLPVRSIYRATAVEPVTRAAVNVAVFYRCVPASQDPFRTPGRGSPIIVVNFALSLLCLYEHTTSAGNGGRSGYPGQRLGLSG